MSSTVCPFCKKSLPSAKAQGPCPSCGRKASDHPSVQGGSQGTNIDGGWGDDDESGDGGLDLAKGSSLSGGSSHAGSAYGGGDLSFGDDDDPFAEDVPDGALELDVPSHHSANTPRSLPAQPQARPPESSPSLPIRQTGPQLPARPPPSDPSMAGRPPPQSDPSLPVGPPSQPSSDRLPPDSQPSDPQLAVGPPTPRRPDPAAMIARYPTPPAKIWESPLYAMKVVWRQFELRQDLASLRKKRSPDVPLYERALKTHDAKTFALGLVITCAILAIFSFIFFLPVILRFVRDPG